MAKIVIDGKTYEVNPDNNLLQECLSQGLDLPYFCWHPCMGSVGACRQCAVKQYRDADDENGMLVMACMTPATDGSIFSVEDTQAKSFRASVIEGLMISHPHDCPVCEEGGECHLQDMTLMSGHTYRRYDKKKVTHRNQYLGPLINHEMNRCITCYRCVRYYNDYAGGTDLSAQASHHHVYFGRHEEGVLESEFSGNLVEVCPTGVFTDKPFSENYSRKWDLQSAPSVCVNCAVGCNTAPGERYGELRRITNRYSSEVNGYFLCDRGRFGYGYVNSDERITEPYANAGDSQSALEDSEVSQKLSEMQQEGVIGIGSPRASNESNYALRTFVGEENFYAGYSDSEGELVCLTISLLQDEAFHCPSIREVEAADAVLILGEDVTNIAPRMALSLRQSVRNKAKELAESTRIPLWQDAAVRERAQAELSPLSILSGYATRLDDIAEDSHIDSLENLVKLGNAIAHKISDGAPASEKLTADDEALIVKIARQLLGAKRPLIISGSSNENVALVKAAANVARALKQARSNEFPIDLAILVPEVNSIGLGMLCSSSNTLGAALGSLQKGSSKNAVILENDLFRRAGVESVNSALNAATSVVVLDQLDTATTRKANIVLPSTAFSEHEATYVNYEGRAQLSFQVHRCNSEAKPSWRWLSAGREQCVEDVLNQCADSATNLAGLKALLPHLAISAEGVKVPRQSHRYSGRTAMKANLNVHEPKQATDDESIMAFSMEGVSLQRDATVLASSWAPQWNSNQSISKFQEEVNGELKQGNPGICLFDKDSKAGEYFTVDTVNTSKVDGFDVLPAFQIFGSEELSARSKPVQQRMTAAYGAISLQDAQQLNLKQGDLINLEGQTLSAELTVCIRSKMKSGTVAVYCGNNEINRYDLGSRVKLSKSDNNSDVGSLAGLIVSDLYAEDTRQ
jgi:NADH-quinone oxidoreductase subunit G